MKKGGGKTKGGAFERECAKLLSLWISEGKNDDVFGRSAGSGSSATIKRKRGRKGATSHDGDMVALLPLGRKLLDIYNVECKFYKSLNLDALLYGKPKNGVLDFWSKLVEESNKVSKSPMLIMKQNSRVPLVAILSDDKLHRHIQQECCLDALAYYPRHGLVLYNFDDLLTEIDPAVLESL